RSRIVVHHNNDRNARHQPQDQKYQERHTDRLVAPEATDQLNQIGKTALLDFFTFSFSFSHAVLSPRPGDSIPVRSTAARPVVLPWAIRAWKKPVCRDKFLPWPG